MKKINKILVPIDFSEISERVLPLALFVAQKFSAGLLVVYVEPDIISYSEFAMADLLITSDTETLDIALQRLNDLTEKQLAGRSVTFQNVILQGQVAEELIKFSEDNDVDLIIMGTHGYRGFEKMFMGSVACRVLKLASCPVITTR